MAGKQIDALTSTRGFAALLIVVFHFGLERFPFVHMQPFFTKGNFGVSYFFVLSGFIMCMVYHRQTISYGNYLQRRIARIAPVYYLGIMLSLLPTLTDYIVSHKVLQNDYFFNLILNMFFAQAYTPGHVLSVNSPGWSLSVEMFFYLLFPLLLWLYRVNERRFLWIALLFFTLSQAVHLFLVQQYTSTGNIKALEFIYYHPVNHLNAFMTGMAGYYFYNNRRVQAVVKYIPSLLLAALMVITVIYVPVSMHNGLIAPLFLLFIITVAQKQPRFLKWKPLVYLGEISYGIYILQMPAYFYINKINVHLLHLGHNSFFYLYLSGLVLIASVCYHAIENPLRKAINKVGNTR